MRTAGEKWEIDAPPKIKGPPPDPSLRSLFSSHLLSHTLPSSRTFFDRPHNAVVCTSVCLHPKGLSRVYPRSVHTHTPKLGKISKVVSSLLALEYETAEPEMGPDGSPFPVRKAAESKKAL